VSAQGRARGLVSQSEEISITKSRIDVTRDHAYLRPMSRSVSRREFVTAAAGAGVTLACAPSAHTSPAPARGPATRTTLLFQGDSITDADRDRTNTASNSGTALGTGYPLLLAAALLKTYPERDLHVLNRGVSGNKVPDLEARWEGDALALQPDVLSVLIGVNDYWHTRTHGYTGTAADYDRQYTALLDETRRRLPRARLVVLEPFVLQTGSVDASWLEPLAERRSIAARVAQIAGATYVPLQAAFDAASAQGGAAHWLSDGVHPTPAGHALIAEQWRTAVGW
jgi:lysophospholipase L1-like esterase